jgi:hypothetical protein
MAWWEADTKRWAIDTARDLAVAVYQGDPLPARPYRIGVVLGPQESAWVECPARFNLDTAPSSTAAAGPAGPTGGLSSPSGGSNLSRNGHESPFRALRLWGVIQVTA